MNDQQLLRQHIEYREYLKSQLPNAGITYTEMQKRLRQVRAIIADLQEKIESKAQRDRLIDAGETQEFLRCGIK